jgi:succinate dehydrogenase/fumarate reductase-like Fe-S protein
MKKRRFNFSSVPALVFSSELNVVRFTGVVSTLFRFSHQRPSIQKYITTDNNPHNKIKEFKKKQNQLVRDFRSVSCSACNCVSVASWKTWKFVSPHATLMLRLLTT